MKYKTSTKTIIRSLEILAIGAFLTVGGVFLWQDQFNFSFFSNASTNTIQAVIALGEKPTSEMPLFATTVKKTFTDKQTKPVELISRAEEGPIVSSLRDQAVLAYNDISKPIEHRVIFTVITGKSILLNGIKQKDSVSSIAAKISKEISGLIDLASARPGVFPSGYTVFLATLPDPLDGTGDVTLCNGTIPNYGKEYTKGVLKEINNSIKSTAAIYPLTIKIVDLETSFSNHGMSSTDSWFKDCVTPNANGEEAIANAFNEAVQSADK